VGDVEVELTAETTSSFESVWILLSSDAQLVLQVASTLVPLHVPASLIMSGLQRTGWDASRIEDAIDDARDRGLAGGDDDDVDVHQLVARFVRTHGPLNHTVRRSLFDGLMDTARAFSSHPGDLDLRRLMHAHSPSLDDWADLVTETFQLDAIGLAIVELGKHAEALPWLERAVAAKVAGDVLSSGGIHLASLGATLQSVGSCYANLGQYTEALP
jgi:hypothetical protein